MKPLRVLHLISRMNSGGTATYLNTLIPELNRAGVTSHLVFGNIAAGESEDLQLDSTAFTRIKSFNREFSLKSDLKSVRQFSHVIKEFAPEIIHSHAFKGGLVSRLSSLKSRKHVHTFHGHHLYDPEFSNFERFVMNTIERNLAKRTDGFIFTGHRVKAELEKIGIGKASITDCIPPGVRLGKLITKKQALGALGMNLEFQDQVVFLWMGRFVDVKRPEMFIEFAKRIENALFIMAGDGPSRANLSLNAPRNLSMVGWQQREILLSAADIVVSTSQSEGMPLSLIEAQIAGLPVVAPDVGSISEVIEDGLSGLLFDGDISDLYQKAMLLFENRGLRSEMSMRAIERASNGFSVDALVSSHLEFYRRVMST